MLVLDRFYRQLALMQRELCQSEHRYNFLHKGYLYLENLLPTKWCELLIEELQNCSTDQPLAQTRFLQDIFETLEPCATYLTSKELSRILDGSNGVTLIKESFKQPQQLEKDLSIWLFPKELERCKVLIWPRFSLPTSRYYYKVTQWITHKLTHIYPPQVLYPKKGSIFLFTKRSPIQLQSALQTPEIVQFCFEIAKQLPSPHSLLPQSS